VTENLNITFGRALIENPIHVQKMQEHCGPSRTIYFSKYSTNLGSRTPRIMNNSVYEQIFQHKVSRMTYCVSSYEHASHQHRGKKERKNKKNPPSKQ